MKKLNNLSLRAKTSLQNPMEISKPLLLRAIAEANELTQKKKINSADFTDIAFVRLLLLLKIEPSEFDEKLYEKAILKINSIVFNEGDKDGKFSVGERASEV